MYVLVSFAFLSVWVLPAGEVRVYAVRVQEAQLRLISPISSLPRLKRSNISSTGTPPVFFAGEAVFAAVPTVALAGDVPSRFADLLFDFLTHPPAPQANANSPSSILVRDQVCWTQEDSSVRRRRPGVLRRSVIKRWVPPRQQPAPLASAAVAAGVGGAGHSTKHRLMQRSSLPAADHGWRVHVNPPLLWCDGEIGDNNPLTTDQGVTDAIHDSWDACVCRGDDHRM